MDIGKFEESVGRYKPKLEIDIDINIVYKEKPRDKRTTIRNILIRKKKAIKVKEDKA